MLSTNNLTPILGQRKPIYPIVTQIVQVTGGSVGNNLYPGVVLQDASPTNPTLRQREPCWVLEPNGFNLPQGLYKARLVTEFQAGSSSASSRSSMSAGSALPVYVASQLCCNPGIAASSSSSAVSHSSVSKPSQSQVSASLQPSGCCFPHLLPNTLTATFSGPAGCALNTATAILTHTFVGQLECWKGNDNSTCDLTWLLCCSFLDLTTFSLAIYHGAIQCSVLEADITSSCGPPFSFQAVLHGFPGTCCPTCSPLTVTITP